MKKESVDNNVHTSSFHRCSLRVNNFFCLKDVYCDFKNINVIIGPQAAGKSLLIKLVALFMSVLQISHLFFTIEKFNKRLLKKIILNYFNSIFSDEYWVHKNFEIEFKYNEFLIKINNKNKKFLFDVNNNFIKYFKSLKIEMKNEGFIDKLKEFDFQHDYDNPFSEYLFIPDDRQLFTSIIKNNIFKVIKQGESIRMDYFMKIFAAQYEKIISNIDESVNTDKFKSIFHGEYYKDDNGEYIIRNDSRIKLDIGSSGQQEVISLLLALYSQKNNKKESVIFIEEPETHLFPETQKHLVEYIVSIYSQMSKGSRFWMTTHSPYVLTTLNNLIVAQEVASISEQNAKRVAKILDKSYWLPYNEVACWYLNDDGSLIDLMDSEEHMIKASKIDEVSSQLAEEFDNLLSIQYGV